MLFDIRPKENRKDLYDREKEIEMIKDSVQRKAWMAVLGMKRVGKTSIVNVSVNETNSIALSLNLMRIYDPRKRNYPKSSFTNLFLESINSTIKNTR
jgi:Archaeal ATPase.